MPLGKYQISTNLNRNIQIVRRFKHILFNWKPYSIMNSGQNSCLLTCKTLRQVTTQLIVGFTEIFESVQPRKKCHYSSASTNQKTKNSCLVLFIFERTTKFIAKICTTNKLSWNSICHVMYGLYNIYVCICRGYISNLHKYTV